MQVITKQVSILISKEEQNRLLDLADRVSNTYICELINCSNCAKDVCEKEICPFYNLDDELRKIMGKIYKAAREYGPKEEMGAE